MRKHRELRKSSRRQRPVRKTKAIRGPEAWRQAFEALEPRMLLSGTALDPIGLPPTFTTTASEVIASIPVDVGLQWQDQGFSMLTNQSGSLIGANSLRNDLRFAGIDGSGFATVIMDTGIDLDDPFFGEDSDSDGVSDRIVAAVDFTGSSYGAQDIQGHGSNVSSIVASSDSTYPGVAPGADIIHLKVLGDDGSGSFYWVEQGLQWVIANAETYNIASVNLSLGDSRNFDATTSRYGIGDEFATLADMDIMVIAAAGNSYYNFDGEQGVGYPAADPNTIGVGAVYDTGTGGYIYGSGARAYSTASDRITPFSQRHETLTDIFAPGAPITGAGPNSSLTSYHGTSQAAPHVAGAAAVMQQLAVQEIGRRLTLDEFRTVMRDTAVTVNDGDDESDNVTNTDVDYKRMDLFAMGEAILAMGEAQQPTYVESDVTIMDAGDSGFHAIGGWIDMVSTAGYDTDYFFIGDESVSNTASATWDFAGLEPGEYRVSLTWDASAAHATDASYTVTALGNNPKVQTFNVDQTTAPSDRVADGASWGDLGIFTVASDGALQVELNNTGASGMVLADAIRLAFVTEQSSSSGSSLAASNSELGLSFANTNVNDAVAALNYSALNATTRLVDLSDLIGGGDDSDIFNGDDRDDLNDLMASGELTLVEA